MIRIIQKSIHTLRRWKDRCTQALQWILKSCEKNICSVLPCFFSTSAYKKRTFWKRGCSIDTSWVLTIVMFLLFRAHDWSEGVPNQVQRTHWGGRIMKTQEIHRNPKSFCSHLPLMGEQLLVNSQIQRNSKVAYHWYSSWAHKRRRYCDTSIEFQNCRYQLLLFWSSKE